MEGRQVERHFDILVLLDSYSREVTYGEFTQRLSSAGLYADFRKLGNFGCSLIAYHNHCVRLARAMSEVANA